MPALDFYSALKFDLTADHNNCSAKWNDGLRNGTSLEATVGNCPCQALLAITTGIGNSQMMRLRAAAKQPTILALK